MQTLSKDFRRVLENTVRKARQVAEAGARAALQQLTVADKDAGAHLSGAQKALRNRLRAHARQLGDARNEQRGTQAIERLVAECAYEHWHRLLFARFLAEAELLIEPQLEQAISLGECQELARESGKDWLELASDYAQSMLPEIFRTGDPVLEVALPRETRSALEDLMKALPREVFEADDSLGWVYQFWQAEKREEVNRTGNKIGAEELPAVTQLFTEDYMVLFLLHNTLGAWWAAKVLAQKSALAASAQSEDELRAACSVAGIEWNYLRFVREDGGAWYPSAGTFDGWPKSAKDITVLDPCMGSGHFLVFALPILAAMRAQEEGSSPKDSIQAVLRDNLFGVEIDPRCTQIAAFNLALSAWRRIGYTKLPTLHLACSGLSLGVSKAEWLKLAARTAQALPVPPKTDLLGTEDNLFSDAMKRGFERLYDLFARAPWLGSLIEPRSAGGDLIESGFTDLQPLLARVLAKTDTAELSEMAVAAQGLAKAAEILAERFTLVVTNVPYLGRGKQHEVIKDYCESRYPEAKADLATCFVERCDKLTVSGGTSAVVAPQNWWFHASSKAMRARLLSTKTLCFLATLGEEAWQTFGNRGPVAVLMIVDNRRAPETHVVLGVDALPRPTIAGKAEHLLSGQQVRLTQLGQYENPDHRITITEGVRGSLLESFANSYLGLGTGDAPHYTRFFWEMPKVADGWSCLQAGASTESLMGGREQIVAWDETVERVRGMSDEERRQGHNQDYRGSSAWGKRGVAVSLMRNLRTTSYDGDLFEKSIAVLIPTDIKTLPAIRAFTDSQQFTDAVRRIDNKVMVTNATLAKVPFDLTYWQGVASEKYPTGSPAPHSNNPTQWLFNGSVESSQSPLQVGVARLVGYLWPRQTGSSFLDCPAIGADRLGRYANNEGIVTLSPVKGDQPAAAQLTALLADAFGNEWSAAKLAGLLGDVGFAGKTLDDWLRDGFFEAHCQLFYQRPYVWHVWDGRRDGFHALVNYHRLAAPDGDGRRTLEKLIYSYLGDWIDRQRVDQRRGVEGSDARVAASEHLKVELENILTGEPPYDIFVRWRSLSNQPIGWEPDINDGVRVNIRPFMMAKPLNTRAKGACILRATPKIKWDKDRGKEPQRSKEEYPWFWGWDEEMQDFLGGQGFDGSRWNDLHYSVAVKKRARGQ